MENYFQMNKVNIWLRNLGLKTNICPFLIHFMQSNASLIRKLMLHNDFIGKNLYSVGRVRLSSTSACGHTKAGKGGVLGGVWNCHGKEILQLRSNLLSQVKSFEEILLLSLEELYGMCFIFVLVFSVKVDFNHDQYIFKIQSQV